MHVKQEALVAKLSVKLCLSMTVTGNTSKIDRFAPIRNHVLPFCVFDFGSGHIRELYIHSPIKKRTSFQSNYLKNIT